MILDLSEDAKEYGRQALRAFEAAGGDQLVQQAEAEPESRESLVGPVLGELGAWELDPRTDADGLEAAAALCRSAGYWALPYPVAERLAKPADLDVDGLIVVGGTRPAGAVAGLESRWATVTVDGTRSTVTGAGAGRAGIRHRTRTCPAIDDDGARDVALGLVLPCWTLLGMLDRAMELTIAHVSLRKQFGQTLSSFQGVQFQLTDAEVERSGVDILAKYALWTIATDRPEAVDDALALRMSAHRGRRGRVPGVPPAARRGRLLRRDHAVVAVALQPAAAAAAVRVCPAPATMLTRRVGRRGLTGLFA